MSDSKESKKTKSISFRLDKRVIDALEFEAQKKEISLNHLVNSTLRNFVNWHSPELSAGFISFPKTTLIRIMEKLTEDEAKQIGKIHFEKDMQEIMLLLRGKFTEETFSDCLETWMKYNNIEFRYTEENGLHRFVIQHDMHKNWSWYLSGFIQETLEHLIKSKVTMIVTEGCVSFEYDASKTSDD